MNLVFITRKIDQGDARAGFVFTWLAALAKKVDRLYVLCQEKGDISGLSDNVEVHSFGKEKGYGRVRQGYKLFFACLKYGRHADGFFVHMMPIYAIIATLPAKLLGKKVMLWYTHKSVDLKLRLAHALVDGVLTASEESFRIKSGKVKVVGHGIDTGKFKMQKSKIKMTNQNPKFKIISIGRISPVKDYETLIKAIDILIRKGIKDLDVEIYGGAAMADDKSYLESLLEFVKNAGLEGIVKFQGELNYDFVDEVYTEADLFVNLSQTGSMDKTVLEAAACGTLALSSNEAFETALQKISPLLFFRRDHPEDLAKKILTLRNLPVADRAELSAKLRSWVAREHDLDNLAKKIIGEFEP